MQNKRHDHYRPCRFFIPFALLLDCEEECTLRQDWYIKTLTCLFEFFFNFWIADDESIFTRFCIYNDVKCGYVPTNLANIWTYLYALSDWHSICVYKLLIILSYFQQFFYFELEFHLINSLEKLFVGHLLVDVRVNIAFVHKTIGDIIA